ncbi:NAD(+)/NADH kinase [Selenomonas sp. TAMA-11512]|uniref:NAD(+)/NADH kinase n=1 Tax=Selenomonas sp. TAMA-11512 TaxID=3095337 RepID=UPI0030D3D590
MMSIGIFPNMQKNLAKSILKRVMNFFIGKSVRVVMPQREAEYFGFPAYGSESIVDESLDIAVSIGGDGTLLGVCRLLSQHDIPVCGINLGTVGFMTDIELNEIEKCLQKLLNGNYNIEERLMLTGTALHGGKEMLLGHAINDIVVSKGGLARMLRISLDVNKTQVADYKADGIIVSTATGSTAYSLSAGGPILNPLVKALLLTPICPHSFNIRPMVVRAEDIVEVHVVSGQDVAATLDGQKIIPLDEGDTVIVRQSEKSARIVKFADKDYYKIVRTKLWGT